MPYGVLPFSFGRSAWHASCHDGCLHACCVPCPYTHTLSFLVAILSATLPHEALPPFPGFTADSLCRVVGPGWPQQQLGVHAWHKPFWLAGVRGGWKPCRQHPASMRAPSSCAPWCMDGHSHTKHNDAMKRRALWATHACASCSTCEPRCSGQSTAVMRRDPANTRLCRSVCSAIPTCSIPPPPAAPRPTRLLITCVAPLPCACARCGTAPNPLSAPLPMIPHPATTQGAPTLSSRLC